VADRLNEDDELTGQDLVDDPVVSDAIS